MLKRRNEASGGQRSSNGVNTGADYVVHANGAANDSSRDTVRAKGIGEHAERRKERTDRELARSRRSSTHKVQDFGYPRFLRSSGSTSVTFDRRRTSAASLMSRTYRYLHYDVFTDRPLEGNQLAVFPEPGGMTPALMQSITREMNFSECTFIFPSDAPGTDVRMRIFTPAEELPMAGHPTVGSTFALVKDGVI
jgi:hypothetical protein